MSKTRSAKPRPKKPAAKAAPARKTAPAQRAPRAAAKTARAPEEDDEVIEIPEGSTPCRSCGKRPGRPTAILGQMTQAELCAQCTALRKERIRLNRAAARGLRSSRLF
jgi:hypothetical protein